MTYPITWLPEVEDDLDEALSHYLEIRFELMERFAVAFQKPSKQSPLTLSDSLNVNTEYVERM